MSHTIEYSLNDDFQHHEELGISVDAQDQTSSFVRFLFGNKDSKNIVSVKNK